MVPCEGSAVGHESEISEPEVLPDNWQYLGFPFLALWSLCFKMQSHDPIQEKLQNHVGRFKKKGPRTWTIQCQKTTLNVDRGLRSGRILEYSNSNRSMHTETTCEAGLPSTSKFGTCAYHTKKGNLSFILLVAIHTTSIEQLRLKNSCSLVICKTKSSSNSNSKTSQLIWQISIHLNDAAQLVLRIHWSVKPHDDDDDDDDDHHHHNHHLLADAWAAQLQTVLFNSKSSPNRWQHTEHKTCFEPPLRASKKP